MTNIKDYILVVENVVSSELCDAVLTEYKESSCWVEAPVSSGLDLQARNCQTICISFDGVISMNKEERQKLDQELFGCASKAIAEYCNVFKECIVEADSGYDLLRYGVGCFYRPHVDSFKDRPRAVSCSFVLNDDYEGGEFAFFARELTYKIEKGSCIMFPSNFMYPHEITPVTSGTRYSIVTWFV
jgi:hypothetical protein